MILVLGFIIMLIDLEKRKNMFEVDEKIRVDILNYFMDVFFFLYKYVCLLKFSSNCWD